MNLQCISLYCPRHGLDQGVSNKKKSTCFSFPFLLGVPRQSELSSPEESLTGEVVGVSGNGSGPSILFSPDLLLNNMTIIEKKGLGTFLLEACPNLSVRSGQPCLTKLSGVGVVYRASVCSAPLDDLIEGH